LATAIAPIDALPSEVPLPMAPLHHRGRPLGGTLTLVWRNEDTLSTSARRFRDALLASARSTARRR
jgi:hypothetical protein